MFYPNEFGSPVRAWVENNVGLSTPRAYAWTIMRHDDNIDLYLNGCQVQETSGKNCWEAKSKSESIEPYDPITFGPLGMGGGFAGFLKDVRYYGYALTGQQLRKNFELDIMRYGIITTACEGDLADIPIIRDYPECTK